MRSTTTQLSFNPRKSMYSWSKWEKRVHTGPIRSKREAKVKVAVGLSERSCRNRAIRRHRHC
jgi:hypothetical protein